MGSDCLKGRATVKRATGRPNDFETVDSVPITFPGGDMEARIPVNLIGNPTGPMNFKVTVSSANVATPAFWTICRILVYLPEARRRDKSSGSGLARRSTFRGPTMKTIRSPMQVQVSTNKLG